MSLANYTRNKKTRYGGAKPEVFVGDSSALFTITWTGDTVSAISGTAKMAKLEGEPNSVEFTRGGDFSNSGFETQELKVSFGHASAALDTSITGLKKLMPVGVFTIYIDNNKQGWIVGIAPATEEMYNDTFRKLNLTYTTGTSVEDVDAGNVMGITLSRQSATVAYPLAATVTASIIDKSAVFIDWV